MRSWRDRVATFFSPQGGDDSIAILRIGLGLQLLLYCVALRRDWTYVFAGTGEGLLSRQLSELLVSAESPLIPRLGWIVEVGNRIGVGEPAALTAVWLLLVIAALGLTAGLLCRTSAVLAWLLHLCAAKSGGLLSYGVDNFMTIGLFYLMCAPLPDRYALDYRWSPRTGTRQRGDQIILRALQLHLCLVYFFGGLTKSLGSGWWDGLNVWRALTRAPFDIISPDTIVRFAPVLPAIGISIWVVELGYAFLIWHRRTRLVWLVLTCAIHLGIAFTMGMYLFAFVMIVLNLAAFGSPQKSADEAASSPEINSTAAPAAV